MNQLPRDPAMLLSVVNTNLRDYYESLEAFCRAKDVSQEEIIQKLSAINYRYDKEKNQFV